MGLFRTLWTPLACDKCGQVERADIQFKTGDDYLEDYELNDVLDDLPPDSIFEGVAGHYCRSCDERFQQDMFDVQRELLADLVATGVVTVTRSGALLSAQEVLDCRYVRGPGEGGLGHWLRRFDLEVESGGQKMFPMIEPGLLDLYERFDGETHLRMQKRGWLFGDEWLRRFEVFVGPDRRIGCRVLTPEP